MDEICRELFAAFDQVVLERIDHRSFHLVGIPADWFRRFFPDASTTQSRSNLESIFPFLENFLIDAERFWQGRDRGILKSGFWSEISPQGQECQLEAFAVCLSNRKVLLLELAEAAYQERYTLIQTGREHQLNHDRLVKEIEKKEILLHCVFHDLVGQLTTFNCCLELLGFETLPDRAQELLNIARTQVDLQEDLVREIVQAFSAEIELLKKVVTDPVQAPNLLTSIQNVVSIFTPTFLMQEKQLQLHPELDETKNWKVVGERSRIERVLSNLVENALRHTLENSTVQINLQSEEKFILCTVDDQGAGVPPESVKYLFHRFFQGKGPAGKAGLGLYFCRITVEHWGGAIGYEPIATGGARFWFRLRKLE
jgi:signal transduction histidine kinase